MLYYVHVVTLGIGSIIQYKLSMSEIIQNWFKVHWASIKQKSSCRISDTAPRFCVDNENDNSRGFFKDILEYAVKGLIMISCC